MTSELENLRVHISSKNAELSSLQAIDDSKDVKDSADSYSPLASTRLGLNIDESLDPTQLSQQLAHLQSTHNWLLTATHRTEEQEAGSTRPKRRTRAPAAVKGSSDSAITYVSRAAYDEMNSRLHVKLSQRDELLRSNLRSQNRLRKLQVRPATSCCNLLSSCFLTLKT